jgi:hypothetical protein
MHTVAKFLFGAAVLAFATSATADAQLGSTEIGKVTVNDPSGPRPDPVALPFFSLDTIKWEGNPNGGSQSYRVLGDSSKPGMYIQLLKWNPGAGTKPHMHDQDRHICVLQGTWWKGTSNPYNAKDSFPMPAGTCLTDVANHMHWDGVRAGAPPAIIYLVGMGPVKTWVVDEKGNPLPPQPQSK